MSKATKTSGKQRKADIAGVVLRCLIVFIVPIIVGIIIFKKKEISPFGKQDLLSVDLWGQYFPMYRKFALDSGFSEAMYNWSGALGFNNWVQNAFYTRSIFLIPFCFISFAKCITYIDIVCLLRFGLGALACQLFLEYKFKSKNPVLMAVSIGYGLCAYSTAFIMQFMWTDGLFLAPLVLLGLERFMNGKSPLMYVLLLALTIYSNFYTGFGTCLFTGFYFLAELFKRDFTDKDGAVLRGKGALKARAAMFGRFSLYSVLGGLLTAFILLPTLKGLSLTESASVGKFDFSSWYHTIADNVSAMLPETPASIEYGVANIAVGLFAFLLIPLYFLNTDIKSKEKYLTGGFLAVLYSGLNYNPMDWLFNGFHFPNQLPGRWSFLFSFAIVIVAANGVAKIKGVRAKSIIPALLASLFFVGYAKLGNPPEEKLMKLSNWNVLLITFAALLLAGSSLTILADTFGKKAENLLVPADDGEISEESRKKADALKKKRTGIRFCSLAVSILLAASMTEELCRNTINVSVEKDGGLPTSEMEPYIKVSDVLYKYGSKYDSGKDEFYRIEANEGWTFNTAMIGDFKGIGYYGSTLSIDVYDLLRDMGNRVYARNVSTIYNNDSLFQNSFFGVKYIIDRSKSFMGRVGKGYEVAEDGENAVVLENPTAFPVAFAVSDDVRSMESSPDKVRPIFTQNEMMNRICGEEVNVFGRMEPSCFEKENAEPELASGEWNDLYYRRLDGNLPVKFVWTYEVPDEMPIYLEQNFHEGTLTINGTDTVDIGTEYFRCLGSFEAGTKLTIEYNAEGIGIGSYGIDVYRFDLNKWNEIYENVKNSGVEVTSFKNTCIKGGITLSQPSTVMSTVPQDGGWKVYVDGKRVKNFKVFGVLTAFKVSAGSHTIELKYSVPALGIGVVISLLALAVLIFCCMVRKKGGIKQLKKQDKSSEKKEKASDKKKENGKKADEKPVKEEKDKKPESEQKSGE